MVGHVWKAKAPKYDKPPKRVEADYDIELHVTKDDIKKAKVADPFDCALARCARATVPGVIAAQIGRTVSYLYFDDKIVRFKTPARSSIELRSFDKGGEFAEGEFYLKAPAPSETAKASTTYSRESKDNKTHKPTSNQKPKSRQPVTIGLARHKVVEITGD